MNVEVEVESVCVTYVRPARVPVPVTGMGWPARGRAAGRSQHQDSLTAEIGVGEGADIGDEGVAGGKLALGSDCDCALALEALVGSAVLSKPARRKLWSSGPRFGVRGEGVGGGGGSPCVVKGQRRRCWGRGRVVAWRRLEAARAAKWWAPGPASKARPKKTVEGIKSTDRGRRHRAPSRMVRSTQAPSTGAAGAGGPGEGGRDADVFRDGAAAAAVDGSRRRLQPTAV
eukprot:scaffold297_cov108-Isochrysis_galbana.AAC.16